MIPAQTYHSFNTLPSLGQTANFDPIFFNTHEFLRLKGHAQLRSFVAVDAGNKVIGLIHFVKTVDHWRSLPGSPFGGLEFSNELDINSFLGYILASFDTGEKLEVVNYPPIYRISSPQLIEFGFKWETSEINHHIPLIPAPKIHAMQQRRFNKCVKAGFRFGEVVSNKEKINLLHQFIAQCRQEQDLKINIPLGEFQKFILTFPDRYLCYVVWADDVMIAATVLVKVNSRIMYNYLPASLNAYRAYSPMVFLLVNVMVQLSAKGFEVLDMGVSSIDGVPQQGLCDFKESMGALRTAKDYFWYRV